MASADQAHDVSSSDEPAGSPQQVDNGAPRIIRLRLAPWDVVSTIVLTTLLVVLAATTNWPSQLFGFLADVCTDDPCAPAPFGIDFYIYPVVWGGIGAAIAAIVIGPLVSLLKGWYMSFWPVLALVSILVAAVTGSAITTFSNNYWHEHPGDAASQSLRTGAPPG